MEKLANGVEQLRHDQPRKFRLYLQVEAEDLLQAQILGEIEATRVEITYRVVIIDTQHRI
jgi:hypothetical protein